MMKKLLFLFSISAVMVALTMPLSAGNLTTKGRAWLDAQGNSAAADVSGVWYSKGWGTVVLHQAPGSRELTGKDDGLDVSGVVVGNEVRLLFSQRDKVLYSAELTLAADGSLSGEYAKGLMRENTKGRAMRLTKR
jgi:hypothetical protein